MPTLDFKIKGIAPLVVHNSQLADPTNHWTKEIKKVSGKRQKVDADFEELAKLEFFGSLYTNEDKQLIVPADCIDAAILGAAKRNKDGKKAKLGIRCSDITLKIDGPSKVDDLFIDKYKYYKIVKVGQARIMRMRPIFKNWSGKFSIEYDDSEVDESTVRDWVETAGAKVGLCERRPMFGRFEVS